MVSAGWDGVGLCCWMYLLLIYGLMGAAAFEQSAGVPFVLVNVEW
jgi:hypothetical protein